MANSLDVSRWHQVHSRRDMVCRWQVHIRDNMDCFRVRYRILMKGRTKRRLSGIAGWLVNLALGGGNATAKPPIQLLA